MTENQNKKLWTEEEDQTLRKAVSLINNDKWNIIAKKFEALYFQTYGVIIRRAGKQCRQRWYNKLHPDLSRTMEPWSRKESVALLTIYQQMGPKWAKIIYKLCELGYGRRSDNNIKNHFHTMVKKSLKDLNQFIEQYNQKVKQSTVPNKVRKVYIYQKTYSIEKQMRKQLKKKVIVENDQMQLLQGSNNNDSIRVEENVYEDDEKEKKQIVENGKSSCEPICKQKQQQQYEAIIINTGDNCTNSNTTPIAASMKSQLLRVIDKNSIDRFWLWSAHKSSGRLEILSSSIQDIQLLSTRNFFIDYMKHPQLFTHQQTEQLVCQINNYTKFCKKLNKKKRQKFIKQKQNKSKYYVQKIAKRIFATVITQQPERKNIFVQNKGKIVQRIVFLITSIYNKNLMFMDEEWGGNNEVISKKEEQEIAKQIIQQVMETQQGNNNGNIEIKVVQNEPECGKQNTIDVGTQTIKLKNDCQQHQRQQQKQQNLVKSSFPIAQKVKKIRKYNRKKPLEKSKQDKSAGNQSSDVLVVVKREQQQSRKEYPLLGFPLIQSQIKIQQPDFGMFPIQTVQQINSSCGLMAPFEQKQKQENNKVVGESYLGEVKVEDNFWSAIKMAEESEKTTEVNHSLGQYSHQQLHVKQQQQQAHINCQFSRQFEDKHIESEQSEHSVGSRKSIRPNKITSRKEKSFDQGQLTLQNKGSFGEIEKMFPDKLVKSIELGQEVIMSYACGDCINPFVESELILKPQSKQQPTFAFLNHLPQQLQSKSPFISYNPSPISPDPFYLLTNSRQFMVNNSHFSNKVGSTQYQVLQKSKTPYNSHQFLDLSCENPFKSNNVQGGVKCGEFQQNANVKCRDNDKQGNFFHNAFFENIRNVEEKPELQWKQPKVYDFEQQKDQLPFPYSRQQREINHFNPFVSQPLDFEIPQKLIDCAKNLRFPIKNYNDYSLNYQHVNQLQYSKMFQFEKSFGLNSARLSQIDLFRSQERSSSHRSRSKDHEGSSNMFKSQRINSVHDSCQFSRSRHLSNSCTYSNNENKPYGSAKQIGQNNRN